MDTAATIIVGRLDALERHRESDKTEAKNDRHAFRNEIIDAIGHVELRVMALERAESASAPKAENAWMKWVMGAGAAVIGWLAYLAFGGQK